MTFNNEQEIVSAEEKKLDDQHKADPEGFVQELVIFLKSLDILAEDVTTKGTLYVNPEIVTTWKLLVESNEAPYVKKRDGYCLYDATLRFLSLHTSLNVTDIAFMARLTYAMAFIHATLVDIHEGEAKPKSDLDIFFITRDELIGYSGDLEESKGSE